ncbi:hypothetical protein BP5796_07126 [Coleophoma crateriformis]|uniref:Uncharacterized protein n=1 Tax=Coleophoma crateriformis TaxID=565419 RepID=A0A3D8RIG6_9HELO|nr:hypothetical protein BP5796_07126 [Coleophoma crateriformis]
MGLDECDPNHFTVKIRDRWDSEFDRTIDQSTHTEILQTSKRIYNEALAILYGELTILVEPGDIICLTKIPDIEPANKRVWRHNPLNCVRSRMGRDEFSYRRRKMDGRMEPHVFARFEKVNLVLSFDWTMGEVELSLDPEYNVNKIDAEEFMSGLRKSTFLEDFVRILSNSYHIRQLSISMNIDIAAFWDDEEEFTADELDFDDMEELYHGLDALDEESVLSSDSEDSQYLHPLDFPARSLLETDDTDGSDSESTVESDDLEMGEVDHAELPDPLADAAEEKVWFRAVKANEKAMDMFLESGILQPLKELSNVETVTVDFDSMMNDLLRRDCGPGYIPQPDHVKMLQELKSEIEGNYKRSQAANGSVTGKRVVAEVVRNTHKKASKSKKLRIG